MSRGRLCAARAALPPPQLPELVDGQDMEVLIHAHCATQTSMQHSHQRTCRAITVNGLT